MPLTLMILPTAAPGGAVELFCERLNHDDDLLVRQLVLIVEEAARYNDKITYDAVLRRDAEQHG